MINSVANLVKIHEKYESTIFEIIYKCSNSYSFTDKSNNKNESKKLVNLTCKTKLFNKERIK